MMSEDPKTNIGVRLPNRAIERLDAIAAEEDRTRAAVARRAVLAWLDALDRPQAQENATAA